jgi:hypothetical protein
MIWLTNYSNGWRKSSWRKEGLDTSKELIFYSMDKHIIVVSFKNVEI